MSDIEVEQCYSTVTHSDDSDEVDCVIGPQHSDVLVNRRPHNTMQNTRRPANRVRKAAKTLSTESARTMTLTDLAGVVSSQQLRPATTVVYDSSGRRIVLPVRDSSAGQTGPVVGSNETVVRVHHQQQTDISDTDQPRTLAGWTTIHQEMMAEYLTEDSAQQPQQQLR